MKKTLLFLFSLSFLIGSCVDSQNTEQQDLLLGSWIFESGTVNGDEAELLKTLEFAFSDKTLTSKILPDIGFKETVEYELKEGQIVVGKTLNMELKEITQDNLFLKFEIEWDGNNLQFDIKFKRLG